MTQEIRYQDYEKLIYKIAQKYSRCGIFSFDELVSDGNETFCRCLESYDSDLSCFATFLYHALNQEFLNKIKKYRHQQKLYVDQSSSNEVENISDRTVSQENICIFANMMAQMSQDAKFICRIILETPLDLIEQIKSKNKKRHQVFKYDLKKYITTKYDWIPWRCEKAFAEIGGLFQ